MPLWGPGFQSLAETLTPPGDDYDRRLVRSVRDLYRQALASCGQFLLPLKHGTRTIPSAVIGGHLWGSDARRWPDRSDVMILGKMLGEEELRYQRHFIGPTGQMFLNTVRELGIRGMPQWYVTDILKCQHPSQKSGDTRLSATWLKDFIPLLQEELRMVRPKYILCLGADAAKALLGKNATLKGLEGRVVEYKIPLHRTEKDEPIEHTALVMTCLHPVQVMKAPENTDQFTGALGRFGQLIQGERWDREEKDLDYRWITDLRTLRELIAEIESCPASYQPARKGRKPALVLGLDAEWHGEHPQNKGSYLRTIQISWKHKSAACIELVGPDGDPAFREGPYAAINELKSLLKSNDKRDVRAVGHFFVADLEWFIFNGLDLTDEFRAADTWQETEWSGGFDTGYAAHALKETEDLSLSYQALRYTSMPRYDVALEEWKAGYCTQHKIKAKDLEGYGPCPSHILVPYGCADADATRRLYLVQQKRLNLDAFGNNCREAFWLTQGAAEAILECNRTGVMVDRPRVELLTKNYLKARKRLLSQLREWAKWPDLNVDSVNQVRELLFGEEFNGAKRNEAGDVRRLRPPGARSLRLKPLLTSGKRPQAWEEALSRLGEEDERPNPSTDKTVLSILAEESQEVQVYSKRRQKWVLVDKSGPVRLLRDYRFVGQVLKSVLREPVRVKEESEEYVLVDGQFVYAGGLPAAICDDDKVRTHLYPTKETGRWGSSRPPLQNLCFDADTELLTEQGWVRADALRSEDRVAQYWPQDRSIDFTVPSRLHKLHFQGEMQHIVGEQLDMLLTPEHRCLLRRRRSQNTFVVPASDFPVGTESQQIHAGFYKGGSKRLTKAQVIWLCAVQADGNYDHGYEGTGIVFSFSKSRKIKRLKQALRALQVAYTCRQHGKVTSFYLGVRQAREFIAWTKGVLGKDKALGAWLLAYDRKTLDLFANEIFLWDGDATRCAEYSSSNEQNADWAQILWTLTGWRARKRFADFSDNRSRHFYINTPARRRDFTAVKKAHVETVAWDDLVYCVTVPSSFIVTRRNGKVAVTGNSEKREQDYKRILGDDYTYPIRSLLKAEEGCVLIDADYVGAELFAAAISAGDKQMIEHCLRNQLPEDHPDYYDIHSNTTVEAFRFNCEPTKAALKAIGKAYMRIAAKCVTGDSRLQTSCGWLRMADLCGELREGETRLAKRGVYLANEKRSTPLLAAMSAGRKRCRKVTTENGYQLEAANGHKFRVLGADGRLRFTRTDKLRPGDWVCVRAGLGPFGRETLFPQLEVSRRTNYIDLPFPRHFDEDWAGFLGLYVAEGCVTDDETRINLAWEYDPDLAVQAEGLLRRVFGARLRASDRPYESYQDQRQLRVSSVKLSAWMQRHVPGDSHTKRVPEFVFRWPQELQSSFLRWAFEGDGSISKNGTSYNIRYATASEQLARDLMLLLSGFGIICRLSQEKREGYEGTYWTLRVDSNEDRERFEKLVGFVTSADRRRATVTSRFLRDGREIPYQQGYLRTLLSFVRGSTKEKCRECVRKHKQVRLSPSRLRLILSAVVADELPAKAAKAYSHLQQLAVLPVSFQQVKTLEDLGLRQVYDVSTTDENEHVVNYNGVLTHQSALFGLMYGRSAKAIALGAKEEGVYMTVEEAQSLIDAIFARYPRLKPFFDECRRIAVEKRVMCGSFGRFRRFPLAFDKQGEGDIERQGMNFPIQNFVADAVDLAVRNLIDYRKDYFPADLHYDLVLQMHDAVLLQVPYKFVDRVITEVLPTCLRTQVPLYPCTLDGMPTGRGPYHFGVDSEVCLNWGVQITKEECRERGIPDKYGAKAT